MIAILLLAVGAALAGPWRGVLDLAGGPLKFGIELEGRGTSLRGRLCNGNACDPFFDVCCAPFLSSSSSCVLGGLTCL